MYFKQIGEIADGTKTQTRRIVKDNELLFVTESGVTTVRTVLPSGNTRLKWQVGRDYAVSPGRGKPGAWWHPVDRAITFHTSRTDADRAYGWRPLRIRITALRVERLQDISEEDAIAEGCVGRDVYTSKDNHGEVAYVMTPRDVYRDLWDTINTRKGTRWDDNPRVWVIAFEVVR
jgi:hypothetical protein